jgi:16S rRNA (adenine1518-N6/adenine1519-N6)-dimethyltransferase
VSHQPRKRFGQNFLRSAAAIHSLMQVMMLQPDDCVVEIGPGLGALTQEMLPVLQHLTAIEIDRDLFVELQKIPQAEEKLNLILADALTFDFSSLTQKPHHLRVIGNLPYNISSPLLFHLLDYLPIIKDMHFLLQKEVVDRMAAKPGTKEYGRLSVMIQYCCDVKPLHKVKPGAFWPVPKVDSSFVRLIPKEKIYSALDYENFAALVTAAFSQRRKTLRNSLRSFVSDSVMLTVGINPKQRAEELKVDDFVTLSNHVVQNK